MFENDQMECLHNQPKFLKHNKLGVLNIQRTLKIMFP